MPRDAKLLSSALKAAAEFYRSEGRPLPWRRDKDAYHVFLSEIMLQQTRVEAVIPYYEKFLTLYPTVFDLARAEETALFKAWEGLGYYSRARNLRRAAERVVTEFDGVFPADFDALLTLPGVGKYTAGAIASIAYGIPRSAVDGNALRIYTRLFADGSSVSDEAFKRTVTRALDEAYPTGDGAADVTQGMMEIGQRFCIPVGAPRCEGCPLRALCAVGAGADYRLYPNKEKKKQRRIEARTVLLLIDGAHIYLSHRPDTGLLAGLWEFPSAQGHLSLDEAITHTLSLGLSPEGIAEGPDGKHVFTHIEWHMRSYLISVTPTDDTPLTPATFAEMKEKYPIPSAFRTFLSYIGVK